MARQPRPFSLGVVSASIVAVALGLAGCGGSGTPAASGQSTSSAPTSSGPASAASTTQAATTGEPAQAPPAGYQWVGIAAQHLWLAVPDSWVALNLNSMSVTQAMARVRLKGLSAAALQTAIERIKQAHGIIVVDAASVASSPAKLATNVNALCTTSALTAGPGAANAIISSTEATYVKSGAHVTSDRVVAATANLDVVRIALDLQTAAGQTIHELQYIDLTGQGELCYTTFSTDRPAAFFPLFTRIAGTIQVG